MCYRTELTYEWKKGIFYSNLWGAYDYRPNAIMDEKLQEDNKIVQTWDNQKDWQKVIWTSDAPCRSTMGYATTFIYRRRNHYIESWKQLFSYLYQLVLRRTSFIQLQTILPVLADQYQLEQLLGRNLSGGENIQILGLYYKYKDLRLGVGAFNPFTDNYKVENENWNQFASYKTKSYIKESSRMFLVSLSYNFSFGRKFKATQRKVNNSDNESGVMSTGK